MIDNRTVGKNIAHMRQNRGWTQQQLAAAMNVSHQAVSKWENGAALPDIQTMMELTRLFGITVEQLVNSDLSAATHEEPAPGTAVRSFVSSVFEDLGNLFNPSKPTTEKTDEAAVKPETEETPKEEPFTETADETESAQTADGDEPMTFEALRSMAPFMSKEALSEIVLSRDFHLTAAQIAQLAPFLDEECLQKLIERAEDRFDWNTLRKLAPFLQKETVDAVAKAIVKGEKWFAPHQDEFNKATEDVQRTLNDVSRKLNKGVKKVVRMSENAMKDIARSLDLAIDPEEERAERLRRLKLSAFEKALENGNWDWIEAHLSELKDDDLKKRISEKANELGMEDWVSRNLAGYVSNETLNTAIENDMWDWLADNIGNFSPAQHKKIALAACNEALWAWLSDNSEDMVLDDCVLDIAIAARKAGERALAAQLAHLNMECEQVAALAGDAAADADADFILMLDSLLDEETLSTLAKRMAEDGNWMQAVQLASKLRAASIEALMALAIENAQFEALDQLEALL